MPTPDPALPSHVPALHLAGGPFRLRNRDLTTTLDGESFVSALRAAVEAVLTGAEVRRPFPSLHRVRHGGMSGDILFWHGPSPAGPSLRVDHRDGDGWRVDAVLRAMGAQSFTELSRSGDPDDRKDYETVAQMLQHQFVEKGEHGVLVTEAALESALECSFSIYEEALADIEELGEIRDALESGEAERRFGRQRVAQYLREWPDSHHADLGGRPLPLPQRLCSPSDGTTLRIHYGWDPVTRCHVIGFVDEYLDS